MTTQPYRSGTDGSPDDAFEPPRRDDRVAADPLTAPAQSSGQDQYPPTGQHEHSATGQDQYPPTGQHEHSATGQDQYPPTGQDQYPPTGQDQYPPTGQDQYPPTGQDQHSATGQDQYPADQDRHAGTDAQGVAAHRGEGSTGVTDAVEQPRARTDESSDDSTHGSLFAEADLTGLRARWTDVQAGFVDDPRKCVQMADGLVADVVQQLTNGFSDARSDLEEQWARGEDVSTEDLRQALKRYRQFFERMLAV